MKLPKCPICSYGSEEEERLPIYPPGEVEKDIAVICPRCHYEVRIDVTEYNFGYFESLVQFFK